MSITESTETVRVVDGHPVPPAGTWAVDAAHSTVEFIAKHLMVTKVRGRFSDYEATIHIADVPEESSVDVTIQVASVSTGDEGRDGHLQGADFFDVENYPTMTFKSTGVRAVSESQWQVTGGLTIRGVTKPVTLDVEFSGVAKDPWGNDKALFEASTEVNREDWDLSWNQPLAGGGVLVSKKVKLEFEIQAARAAS
jgi:polyisoprenoid-binding protein YceI